MDAIPAELGVLILKDLPDVESLWAFVRASSHIYRIFNSSRGEILATVIAREIGPLLMGEALAALASSRFPSHHNAISLDTEQFSRGIPKSEALEWIETYYLPKSEALYWVEFYLFESEKLEWIEGYRTAEINRQNTPPPLEDMLTLWELHKEVKYMADIYVQRSLHVFNQSVENFNKPPTSTPGKCNPVSSIEKQRIFRAIYRFVIFGNLFAPSSDGDWEEMELSQYFLCRFTAWQVEEIACIFEFMTDKIAEKLQEMEKNTLDRLVADLRLSEEKSGLSQSNEDSLTFSSQFPEARERQAFLLTLPIKDLRMLFEAQCEELEEVVREFAARAEPGVTQPFLGEALSFDPDYLPVNPGGEMFRCDAGVEAWDDDTLPVFDPSKGNSAMLANRNWFWANWWYPRELYVESTFYSKGREKDFEGLRRAGYVFWDNDRLDRISHYESKGFGEKVLETFPRPSF